MLGGQAIKDALALGQIVISPFNEKQLGSNSYDLRAGEWIVRQRHPLDIIRKGHFFESTTLNTTPMKDSTPRDPADALPGDYDDTGNKHALLRLGNPIEGNVLWSEPTHVDGGTIRLAPGELILMLTQERVGCYGDIIGEMSSRSSFMRCGMAVCVDAGLGDVGFDSHWTMEVFNHTRIHIEFHVGDRIGQMKFHRIEGLGETYAERGGTYGHANDEYRPSDMIPRSNMS